MASRLSLEPKGRPEAGHILIVIHDFSARSSDELSLLKGDRVELIERDDDFGDGWYLGRHMINGNSGLFPEVYTRIAPRGPPSYPPTTTNAPRPPPPATNSEQQALPQPPTSSSPDTTTPKEPPMAIPVLASPSYTGHNPSEMFDKPSSRSISSPILEQEKAIPPSPIPIIMAAPPKNILTVAMGKVHGNGSANGQDSPVMNETLSVIDEHIIDMNSPHHSIVTTDRRGTNDSGSEYSSPLDHRLSYINGEETDEEEDQLHTRQEVSTWSSDQVAEYLFTSGVETKHCEVFRDQEITGDVLLGMDQTSVFLKEFDLGSVGRRLKTWQKIKGLQDEVNGETSTRRNTGTYGSEVGSDDGSKRRSRSITSPTMLPRILSMNERSEPRHNSRLSQQHILRNDPIQSTSVLTSPISPMTKQDNTRPLGEKRRPSAASIRDMHHSRQSSVNEYSTPAIMNAGADDLTNSPRATTDSPHKKQASFDKNWTMGFAASPSTPNRPLSSSGLKGLSGSSTDQVSQTITPTTTLDSLDRGYFSGGEAEGRQRNVLRKRGSTATATHSRNSSYTDEQRQRSATAHTRHSRFGSVDSIRESAPPSAAQKYYGLSVNGRRRTPSENSISTPPRPMPPPKDLPSPTVTKLEGSLPDTSNLPTSPDTRQGRGADWLLPVKPVAPKSFGLRAISDAVTGNEKSRLMSPNESVTSPVKESPLPSPARTGSSTPSGGPSFDLDEVDAKGAGTMLMPNAAKARKKTKKETSAYTRGLEKKTPKEQMVGADYSGWMRKRGPNLISSWKPRLFILKGRRLSYYYSEDDDQEKGLIDISFHRVLPADGDRLTGLSAVITGAANPTSPTGTQTLTMADVAAAAEPESTLSKGSGDSMFLFKLVPPREGSARGVTFTKPTVHYFAVPNIKQGRLWMAALMKATIERDEKSQPTSTYQQKTISLKKAQQMRHRPPALMNLEEHVDEEALKTPASDKNGLNIQGIIYDRDVREEDSGVSGVSKADAQPDSAKATFLDMGSNGDADSLGPRTA